MRTLFRSALLGLLCLALTKARATIMVPLPVENLAHHADLILRGTITNKVCLKDEAGRIYTQLALVVSEVWKGDYTNHVFNLIQWGGTVGDLTTVVGGEAYYEVGEEIVSFIARIGPDRGVSIGLGQGKFHVAHDAATGARSVHNFFHGEPREPESPAAAELRRAAGKSKRLDLIELKTRATGGSQ